MPAVNPALVAINKQNKMFWEGKRLLLLEQIADLDVREAAFETLRAQWARGVPARFQKCFYEAFEEAARSKRRFASSLGRAGGRAKRGDALQILIEQIVAINPRTTQPMLTKELQKYQEIRKTVEDIDDEAIFYLKTDGSSCKAPLSGLKDRLYRAKKKVNSRKSVAASEP